MQIAIGSDHAGFERKKEIIEHLQSLGHTVLDLGTFSKDSMDYPDIAVEVAEKVLRKELSNKADQESYIQKLADGVKLN